MGFSFIVCSFTLPFIQTCAECLYAGWLVKTLPGLHVNQRHRCQSLGEQNLWADPPTCERPWHLPSLLWCCWLRKKEIKPSSNEVHCVCVFAYLRVYTWQSSREDFGWTQGISGERITKFGTCWPENFLWSDRPLFPTQPSSSERWRYHFQWALLLLLDFSSIVLKSEASVFVYWFFRFSYNLLTSCCER